MNIVTTAHVLMPSQIQPGIQLNRALSIGGNQPLQLQALTNPRGGPWLALCWYT